MIGKKIQKPVADASDYTKTALWCNANNAVIEDKGNWYEVVALPEQSLTEAKAAKLAEINSTCDRILKEAEAYEADPDASVALRASLASARGIELPELVVRVMAKHEAYSVLSGAVIGQRQALEDKLDACASVEEINALAVNIAMPS